MGTEDGQVHRGLMRPSIGDPYNFSEWYKEKCPSLSSVT